MFFIIILTTARYFCLLSFNYEKKTSTVKNSQTFHFHIFFLWCKSIVKFLRNGEQALIINIKNIAYLFFLLNQHLLPLCTHLMHKPSDRRPSEAICCWFWDGWDGILSCQEMSAAWTMPKIFVTNDKCILIIPQRTFCRWRFCLKMDLL